MNATPTRSLQSRTTVVTFLGAVVRPLGGWMPIAGAVDLLGELGLDAPGVRTAVFRLKKKGWLDSAQAQGARGYELTASAQATLRAGDEIIWHARRPAELSEGWCIVHFGVPEKLRAKRHQLRAHLTHLGFGNVGTALWIAPARLLEAAEQAISELDLADYAAVFTGAYRGPRNLTELLYDAWDLHDIDRSYREFIDDHAPWLDTAVERTGSEAFTSYVDLVDAWRKLPFRDPGLPREVLAPEWSGPEAVDLFERLVATLEAPALEHARAHWPS